MNIKFFARTAALIALTLFAFAACKKGPKQPDDPRNNNNQDPAPQPTEQVTPGLSVTASYFGNNYANDFHDYILVFQVGEIDESGYFKAGGVELSLEVLTATGSSAMFPAGIYELTDNKHNSAGIVISEKSTDDKGNVSYGDTYCYTEQDADNYWLEPVDFAHLDVEVNGAQYTIKVNFKVGEEELTYLYKGALAIYDERPASQTGEGPEGDYDFKADGIEVYNDGFAWTDNTYEWEVYFTNSKDENEYVVAQFIGAATTDEEALPTGTFMVPKEFDIDDLTYIPVPGTLCPTYPYANSYYGTYYSFGEWLVYYSAMSGNLNISKSGNLYTFSLSFTSEEGEKVTVNYTGEIEVDLNYFIDSEDDSNLLKAKKAPQKLISKKINNTRHAKAACRYAVRLS